MIVNNKVSVNNPVQSFIPTHNLYHNHKKYEACVERAKQLFLDGYCVNQTLSGKDSGAASICVVEGLLRAKKESKSKNLLGSLYFVTTDTGLDNIVLHSYMMDLHSDAVQFGVDNDLPIFSQELKPALSENPWVEYIGRGKLLRTPQTGSSKNCAISWKINPMKKFIALIEDKYRTSKIVTITGSRSSESRSRKASLLSRNESSSNIVKTDLGYSLPIIMDWDLNDVWQLFKITDDGDIDSYSERFGLMRKHYASANGGVCDLFAKNAGNLKNCGARFGCSLCSFSGESDNSLEAQIETDKSTYGFMLPLNKLRTFMLNTVFDFQYRSILGSKVTDGFIKIGFNQYNLKYRQDLLRYVLTMQNESFAYGGKELELISLKELVAIQYHWTRSGLEEEPGTAFKIFDEICTQDIGYYPIPDTTYVEQSALPEYQYFDLETHVKNQRCIGLDDTTLDGINSNLARQYRKDGSNHRVIRFFENKSFNVVTKDALAMFFVTDFYPQLLEDGKLENLCPTVLMKNMLECGLIEISKGSIARLNNEIKVAQTLNSLRNMMDTTIEKVVTLLSVSERRKDEIVAQRKLDVLENSKQPLLL